MLEFEGCLPAHCAGRAFGVPAHWTFFRGEGERVGSAARGAGPDVIGGHGWVEVIYEVEDLEGDVVSRIFSGSAMR